MIVCRSSACSSVFVSSFAFGFALWPLPSGILQLSRVRVALEDLHLLDPCALEPLTSDNPELDIRDTCYVSVVWCQYTAVNGQYTVCVRAHVWVDGVEEWIRLFST